MNEYNYIKERLEERLAYFNARYKRLRIQYTVLAALSILAPALIPVLILAAQSWEGASYIIAFLASVAAVSSGALLIGKFRENTDQVWSICEKLRSEHFRYTSRLFEYTIADPQKRLELLVVSCEAILGGEQICKHSIDAHDAQTVLPDAPAAQPAAIPAAAPAPQAAPIPAAPAPVAAEAPPEAELISAEHTEAVSV